MQDKSMTISPDGWLSPAKIIKSPNFDPRPHPEISLLVIHCISLPPGEFGTGAVSQLFTNQLDCESHPYYQEYLKNKKLSAHVFITREGEIIQLVSFLNRAWHAGISNFNGRDKCNDFSVGIELEGTETSLFEPCQYLSLIQVTKAICKTYPEINSQRILGHEDIAPGRKKDPGECFDWDYFKKNL